MYGLKIAHMDSNGRIDSVVCRFCTTFGEKEEEGDEEARKRKRTSNAKYFSSFRVDNYTTHLSKQHPCKWLEYRRSALIRKIFYIIERRNEPSVFRRGNEKKIREYVRAVVALENHNNETTLNEAWSAMNGRFYHLMRFSGGPCSSISPGTAAIRFFCPKT